MSKQEENQKFSNLMVFVGIVGILVTLALLFLFK
jgi:hypothetical protein